MFFRDADVGPIGPHGVLDIANGNVPLLTAGRVSLAAEAVEVRVRRARLPLHGDANAQTTTAAGTEQEAFQVVWQLPSLILIRVAGIE